MNDYEEATFRINRIIFWLIVSVVVVIPLFHWSPMVDMYDLAKASVFRWIILAVVFLWALKVALSSRWSWRRSPLDVPLVFYLLALTLCTIFSVNPIVSLVGAFKRHESISTFLAYAITFWATYNFLKTYSELKRVKLVILLTSLPISIYAIAQRFGWDYLTFSAEKYELTRSFGTLGNPVFLASYAVLILPLALGSYFREERSDKKSFYLVTFLLAFAALLFTYSRGGWVGAIASLTVFVIFLWKEIWARKTELLALATIVILLAVFINFAPFERKGSAESIIGRAVSGAQFESGSSATRVEMWKSTLRVIKRYSLTGTGIEVFKLIYPRYRTERLVRLEGEMSLPDRPHNELLYLFAAAGMLTFLTYLWILFVAAARFLKWHKKKHNENLKIWTGALFASVVGYVVAAFFSFSMITVTPVFWVVMGLLTISVRTREETTVCSPHSNILETSIGKVLLLIPVAILVIVGAYYTGRFFFADVYYKSGSEAMATGNISKLIDDERKAIQLNPWQNTYRLMLSAALQESAQANNDKLKFDEAIAVYEEGIRFDPNDEDMLSNLGDAYRYYGFTWDPSKLEMAAMVYRRAIRIDPWFSAPERGLGIIELDLGRARQAAQHLRRALSINPGDLEARYYLGLAYADLSEKDPAMKKKAIEVLQHVLASNPAQQGAKDVLERLQGKKK